MSSTKKNPSPDDILDLIGVGGAPQFTASTEAPSPAKEEPKAPAKTANKRTATPKPETTPTEDVPKEEPVRIGVKRPEEPRIQRHFYIRRWIFDALEEYSFAHRAEKMNYSECVERALLEYLPKKYLEEAKKKYGIK